VTGVSVQELGARRRESTGEPAGALVLLHGRGADEHDLFPLLDLLDPARRLLGVTPGGPLHLPPGGKHWYTLGGIPTPDAETFHATAPLLAAFLDALPMPMDRVVLGGFSQGAVMSYAMSLGPGRPRPAGLVAMSGFLPRVEYGREAAETLSAAGVDVLRLESAVPHMVDPAWIDPLRRLVAEAVP
jgi:phospholipase/carboxylesterase